uniref:Glutaredoxin n=1 Tax=Echinococcus granulosus TaxID=6210 RepID=A0A068WJX1_ECHGR|nr:glutaredoxin [Echinococcus granulosus]
MDSRSFIEAKIAQRPILLIGKAYDPLSREVAQYLRMLDLYKGHSNIFEALYIDQRQDVSVIDTYIYQKWLTKCRTVPHLFIRGEYIAGGMDLIWLLRKGMLRKLFTDQCIC